MRRPGNQCLDCGHPLELHHNFCPNCGQENTDQQVSLKMLVGDFLSNYFSFDSRLGRSLKHFFFKPGSLTRSFNEGKRMRYVHPLRLYLVVTFLFFLVLSYLMLAEFQEISFIQAAQQGQSSYLTEADSAVLANAREQVNEQVTTAEEVPTIPFEQNGDSGLGFQQAIQLMADVRLTDQMVMDSLQLEASYKSSERFLFFLHQGRRVVQKDLDVFIPYVIKNLPIMMFILLPVFAFYLMYLFRNKPNLYIQHIIHSLHVHSMAFVLLTIFMIIGWLSGEYFFWTTFLLITLYALFSTKRVYNQPWPRTGWKFLLLGMFYFSSLFMFVLLELGISFLTF